MPCFSCFTFYIRVSNRPLKQQHRYQEEESKEGISEYTKQYNSDGADPMLFVIRKKTEPPAGVPLAAPETLVFPNAQL